MELYQIQYFKVLCEEKSYTKAAKRLIVSQPTVSIAIKKLEDEFGCALIDKSQSQFTLTKVGKAFLEHAIKIDKEIEITYQEMLTLSDNHSEAIRIDIPDCICTSLLSKFAQDYIPSHPETHVLIRIKSLQEILKDLEDQQTDIAVICSDILSTNQLIGIKPYKMLEFYAAIPYEDHLSTFDILPRKAFRDKTLLIPEEGGILAQFFRRFFEEDSIYPDYINWISDDLPVHDSYRMASKGLGIALTDENVKGLKCVPFDPSLNIRLVIAWTKITFSPNPNSDNRRIAAKKELIDYIISI